MGKLKIVKDGKGKSLPSDLYPHQARIPTSVHPLMLEFLRSKMTSSDDPFFHSSSAGYLSYHKVGWDNLYSGDYDTDHHMLTCGATIPDDTNIYEATKFEFAGTFAPQNENAIIFAYSGNGYWLVMGGMMTRSACGNTTKRNTKPRRKPRAPAASHWPFCTA